MEDGGKKKHCNLDKFCTKACNKKILKFITSRVDNVVNICIYYTEQSEYIGGRYILCYSIIHILHRAEYTGIGASILACKGGLLRLMAPLTGWELD